MTEVSLNVEDYKRIMQWASWYVKKSKNNERDRKLINKLQVILEEEQEIEKESLIS